MCFHEVISPVIQEITEWVLDKLTQRSGPSKSELKLTIEDLELQLDRLAEQNRILTAEKLNIENQVINILIGRYQCQIDQGVICPNQKLLDLNQSGSDSKLLEQPFQIVSCENYEAVQHPIWNDAAHVFDDMDEEIDRMRKKYPGRSVPADSDS